MHFFSCSLEWVAKYIQLIWLIIIRADKGAASKSQYPNKQITQCSTSFILKNPVSKISLESLHWPIYTGLFKSLELRLPFLMSPQSLAPLLFLFVLVLFFIWFLLWLILPEPNKPSEPAVLTWTSTKNLFFHLFHTFLPMAQRYLWVKTHLIIPKKISQCDHLFCFFLQCHYSQLKFPAPALICIKDT